jgi:hypothetical protein
MYSSARFLKYAKEFLGIHVEQESINQVREITQLRNQLAPNFSLVKNEELVEKAVAAWLQQTYSAEQIMITDGFPDIVVISANTSWLGFEIKRHLDKASVNIARRLRDFRERASLLLADQKFEELTLIMVVANRAIAREVNSLVKRFEAKYPYEGINTIVGVVTLSGVPDHNLIFEPIVDKLTVE